MSELRRNVLLSRMSAAIEGVLTMISKTATRPGLSIRGMSNCEMTACITVESWMRICSCWFVVKLDGILNGDDVGFIPFFIDDINHRGESSALSRTGRASDEDQPARLVEQLANGRRQADLFEQQKFGRNLAQHQPKIASFLENADAETRQFTEGEAKVSAAALAHVLDVV